MSAGQDHSTVASIDARTFRQVMSQFVTGVTVVTSGLPTGHGGAPTDLHGMTCNSFTSVSSETSCISVCLTTDTRTARLIIRTGSFAVNILGAAQSEVANRFAGRHKEHESDRFNGIAWRVGSVNAVPILDGAKAVLECRLVQAVDCGDHTLFVGRVITSIHDAAATPMVFYGSRFVSLASG